MTRALPFVALTIAGSLACAHRAPRSPAQDAMIARADCGELLRAADAARAGGSPELAADLAAGCPQEKLDALVAAASPEEGLLWCGRARAAGGKPSCTLTTIGDLTSSLHPRIRLGPPDAGMALDPLLGAALDALGKELNLSWDPVEPDVIVGRMSFSLDHLTSRTSADGVDAKGAQVRVPATQHRFVGRVEAQVELGSKTRTLRATEEARETTPDVLPQQAAAAKFEPQPPPEADLRKRAAMAWLRALGKALAAAPPEGIDATDVRGCVAYGLSLNLSAGDVNAAAHGLGDPAKVAACERLLGEPAGAGIPVP